MIHPKLKKGWYCTLDKANKDYVAKPCRKEGVRPNTIILNEELEFNCVTSYLAILPKERAKVSINQCIKMICFKTFHKFGIASRNLGILILYRIWTRK